MFAIASACWVRMGVQGVALSMRALQLTICGSWMCVTATKEPVVKHAHMHECTFNTHQQLLMLLLHKAAVSTHGPLNIVLSALAAGMVVIAV